MGLDGQLHAPAALPLGETRYPLCRRLGGTQDRSGRVRKVSPPQGFDNRTVQPVARRYTDCTFPAHLNQCTSYVIYIRPRRHVHMRGNRNVSILKRNPLNRGASKKTGSCHYSWTNPIQTFGFLFLSDKTHCIYLQLAVSPMFLRHQQPSLFLTNNIGLMANSNQSSHRSLAHMAV